MIDGARALSIVGVDASPSSAGKTYAAVDAIVKSCERAGATTSIVRLQQPQSYGEVTQQMLRADAVVIGSPVYRASFAWPLKVLLDATTRDLYDDGPAVLRGKAVAMVMTTGSPHHFLALDDLRNVLAGFFAAHVLPPGLSVPASGFGAENVLTDAYMRLAEHLGTALVELAAALAAAPALRSLEPQV